MSQIKPPADPSHFEMDVQEDVTAGLEAFILHYRLGLWKEANEVLDKALWYHLAFFPVFAEVAIYPVERTDNERFLRLMVKVREENLVFAKIEEKEFVEIFITSYQSKGRLPLLDFYGTPTPFRGDSRSPIQVQARQIQTTTLLRNLRELRDRREKMTRIAIICLEYDVLINEGFGWKALRMFSLACLLAPQHVSSASDDRNLLNMYKKLMQLIVDDNLLQTKDIDGKAGELLTSVHAKISFAKILLVFQEDFGRRSSNEYDLHELCDAATERLEMGFQLLPDSKPRGEYANDLRSLKRAAPHSVTRTHAQFTSGPLPAEGDDAKLSQDGYTWLHPAAEKDSLVVERLTEERKARHARDAVAVASLPSPGLLYSES